MDEKASLSARSAEDQSNDPDGPPASPTGQSWRSFLFEDSRDYIARINRDYGVEEINAAGCEAHGLAREDVVGAPAACVWGKRNFERRLRELLERCFAGETAEANRPIPIRGPKGNRFWNVVCHPERSADESVTHAVLVAHDVSEVWGWTRAARDRLRLFREALEVARHHALLWDRDLKCVYANRRAREFIGLSLQEAVGRPARDVFRNWPELADLWAERLQRALALDEPIAQQDQAATHGQTRFFETGATPVRNGKGEAIAVLFGFREVTSRMLSHRATEEREARLRGVFASLHEAIISVFDREGVYQEVWAPEKYDLLGKGIASGAVGRSVMEMIPEEHARQRLEKIRQVFETGEPVKDWSRIPYPGGHWDFDLSLTPVRGPDGEVKEVASFARDVSELKRAQEELETWRSQTRQFLSQLGVLLFSGRIPPQGGPWRIQHANPEGFKAITGYTPEESIATTGEYLKALILPEDLPRRKELARRLSRGEIDHFDLEFRIRHADGGIRWVACSTRAWPLADSSFEVATIVQDITERKRAEAALRESERRLREVFDVSRDVIYRLNLATGGYDYLSPACLDATGFTREEILAMPLDDFLSRFHPEDFERLRDGLPAALRGKPLEDSPPHLEYRWQRKDGRYVWFSDHRAAVRDADGRIIAVVGSVRDIDHIKRTEEELRRAHDELERRVQERTAELARVVEALLAEKKERKAAEQALERSERLHRTAIEAAGSVPFSMEGPHNTYEFLGEGITALTGYPREGFNPGTWEAIRQEIIPTGRYAGMTLKEARKASRSLPGQTWTVDWRIRTRDGEERWLSCSMARLRDAEGHPLRSEGLFLDITERKRMEAALRADLQRYEVMLNTTTDGFWLADLQGRLLEVNDAYCRLVGYSRDELLRMSISDVEVTETPEDIARHVDLIVASGIDRFESRHRRKDGRVVDLEISVAYLPSVSRLVNFMRDITDRKRMEKALRESEERYRLLVENQTDMIAKTDLEGRMQFASPTLCDMVGKAPEEVIGRSFLQYVHEDDRAGMIASFQELAKPPYSSHVEIRVPTRRGLRWQGWNNRAQFDDRGRLVASIGVGRDITERKQAEEELRRSRDHLAQLNLELAEAHDSAQAASRAKSTFLANMSHELRTPLNSIIGFSRIVSRKAEGVLPDRQVENLHRIHSSAAQLMDLLNDILDLSKIEAGAMTMAPEWLHLPSVLHEASEMMRPLMERNGNQQRLELPADLPSLYTDSARVRQIALNLLSNAAKFTQHGEVVLSAAYEPASPPADPADGADGSCVVRVRDTGIGMSPRQLAYIFEAFRQGDESISRKYGGTGLGLAISRRLASLLGGDLQATSELGVGSVFTLRLPMRFTPGEGRATWPES
ncbi:MAG: PAS domain S-box protein [Candidatus Sumerlaeota bacterium]|nr:PAS domain S-box protein [Candidatus Sumerlaeota bacterium]